MKLQRGVIALEYVIVVASLLTFVALAAPLIADVLRALEVAVLASRDAAAELRVVLGQLRAVTAVTAGCTP